MGRVQLVKLSVNGISRDAVSAPGHPNLWKTIEQTCGALRFFRSQALVIEWASESDASRLPSADNWKSWLCVPSIHSLELFDNAQRVTLQIRRKGFEPDALATLALETLRLKGFSNVERVWFARQTEIVIEKASEGASREALLETLKLVAGLEEKSGVFRPSTEEIRILIPGDSFAWRSESHTDKIPVAQLKTRLAGHMSKGSWSPLKRNYRTRVRQEWSQALLSETTRNPSQQIAESFANTPYLGDQGSPVDFVVSLPKNPDSYSSMDKLRVRCVSFANLLDRPVGQVLFRKAHSGMTLFDCWSSLGSHQKIDLKQVRKDQVLCLLGSWDRRNPIAERRIDDFLRRLRKNDPDHECQYEILPGSQDWLAYFAQQIHLQEHGWQVFVEALSTLSTLTEQKTESSALILGWVPQSKIIELQKEASLRGVLCLSLARACTSEGVNLINEQGQKIEQLSAHELFSASVMRELPLELSWSIPEEKSPIYGFDRAAVYPDEYLLRLSFREPSFIDWVQHYMLNASGEGYRSLFLRTPACEPLNCLRWSDGRRLWASAIAQSSETRMFQPHQAALYTLDAAFRALACMGADPREALVELMLSIPRLGVNSAGDFEASMILQLESLSAALKELKIPFRSLREISSQLGATRSELFVRVSAPVPDSYPPPFPGLRMVGEQIYALGPRAVFMDAGSRILEYFSRIESNHLSQISNAALFEVCDTIIQLQKNSLLSCIRPIGDGGVAGTLGEMGLWSKMGAQIRPGLSPIDMFSASPARFLVGVLPANISKFEAAVRSEWLLPVATVGGEKIFGLGIDRLQSSRGGQRSL